MPRLSLNRIEYSEGGEAAEKEAADAAKEAADAAEKQAAAEAEKQAAEKAGDKAAEKAAEEAEKAAAKKAEEAAEKAVNKITEQLQQSMDKIMKTLESKWGPDAAKTAQKDAGKFLDSDEGQKLKAQAIKGLTGVASVLTLMAIYNTKDPGEAVGRFVGDIAKAGGKAAGGAGKGFLDGLGISPSIVWWIIGIIIFLTILGIVMKMR